MPTPASLKRATVYFDSAVHGAFCPEAVETGRSVFDVVDGAVGALLGEDADGPTSLRDRADEPTVPFESFIRDLRSEGAI